MIRKDLRIYIRIYIYVPEQVDCDSQTDVVTVGHCGVSEVKNYINTVQFLAQTDRFVS